MEDNLEDILVTAFPVQHVPDHMVVLSFNEDQHALAFQAWLSENWEEFQLWYRGSLT